MRLEQTRSSFRGWCGLKKSTPPALPYTRLTELECTVNIDKNQIIDMLKNQGDDDKAEQANKELPDQVDTDNDDHQNLLSKFGVNPSELISKLGGNLPGGLGDKLGGV